jgi:hypothetical protein
MFEFIRHIGKRGGGVSIGLLGIAGPGIWSLSLESPGLEEPGIAGCCGDVGRDVSKSFLGNLFLVRFSRQSGYEVLLEPSQFF